jgi:hypothetical protein
MFHPHLSNGGWRRNHRRRNKIREATLSAGGRQACRRNGDDFGKTAANAGFSGMKYRAERSHISGSLPSKALRKWRPAREDG